MASGRWARPSAGRTPPLAEARAVGGSVEIGGRPGGIELPEEQGTPFGFVVLSDAFGGIGQSGEAAEEPSVVLVDPSDMAAPPPAVGSETIEASVIADPVGGIGLDIVAAELAEAGPTVEEPRMVGDDGGHRGSTIGGVSSASGLE